MENQGCKQVLMFDPPLRVPQGFNVWLKRLSNSRTRSYLSALDSGEKLFYVCFDSKVGGNCIMGFNAPELFQGRLARTLRSDGKD